MSCIDNLLGVKDPCSAEMQGKGIFDVTEAIGFSWNRASNLAQGNGLPTTGYESIVRLRNSAYREVMIDIMQEMMLMGFISSSENTAYRSGVLGNNVLPAANDLQGIQIRTANECCTYKGAKLKDVTIYSATSFLGKLFIQVNGQIVSQININVISNVPFTLNSEDLLSVESFSGAMTIYIQSDTFTPYEVKPHCGCGTSETNKCAKSTGYINQGGTIVLNNNLGYGIIANVVCECDYDKIICSLPNKESLARLILNNFEKSLCELALNVDRYSFYTIYDRETIKENYNKKLGEYKSHLKSYLSSIDTYLRNNLSQFCGCITCQGSTIKSLI